MVRDSDSVVRLSGVCLVVWKRALHYTARGKKDAMCCFALSGKLFQKLLAFWKGSGELPACIEDLLGLCRVFLPQ